ncbi:MAG: hypothetical protein WCO71_02240 [Pseudomonadota bacterium]
MTGFSIKLTVVCSVLTGLLMTRPAMAVTESDVISIGEKNPAPKSWLSLDTGLTHITPNIDAKYIAFIPEGKPGIRILNVASGKVFEPSGYYVGGSFFWSPDGARIFYRELISKDSKTSSRVRAWDVVQNKNIEVESFEGSSGLLTFDPRDNKMMLMHGKGIKSKKLVFPDNRLAYWQSSQRKDTGKWVMAQKGATFVTDAGFAMQKLVDDGSGIESFDISPDGSTAAWATRAGRIYTSKSGQTPEFLDWGRDPNWHPEKLLLVYARGRMVGNKAADYDIKLASPGAKGSFLTATQHSEERWPAWHPDGKSIFYTVNGTTDLRVMKFEPSKSIAKADSDPEETPK